jgi:hypothetical protein
MSGSTSSGRGPNCETDVMGHVRTLALQQQIGEALRLPSFMRRVVGRKFTWVLRHKDGTLTRGRSDCFDRELPKNGDVPKSPLN